MPSQSPCTLRIDPATGMKGPVHSEKAAEGNTYNQNFKNRFCGCEEVYDAHKEKGTMFQCLGLATENDGGCGEDWWHPECLVGPGRCGARSPKANANPDDAPAETKEEENVEAQAEDNTDSCLPQIPGFPHEDDFETFICYKCVEANPWVKRYAGTEGFLPPVYKSDVKDDAKEQLVKDEAQEIAENTPLSSSTSPTSPSPRNHKKRKLSASPPSEPTSPKKPKLSPPPHQPHHEFLPPPPPGSFSIFLREDFRTHFCRCASCYPALSKHPQLLEEEESYEPPLSENGDEGGESVGTGSLLDRGEAALSNMDRVRAIGLHPNPLPLSSFPKSSNTTNTVPLFPITEGVMVYNHLKDKVKSFLQPFAESGQAVGAEDIKAYFEKLRGDEQAVKAASGAAVAGGDEGEGDGRREQRGY
jgi:E3 ubiquitin-protein ligase UBR7